MDCCSDFYCELKEWQAGIGSAVGFVALMIAALSNFRLNRRRDAENLRAEAKSVLAALYGEIIQLRTQIGLLARIVAQHDVDVRDFDEQFVADYMPDAPVVFPALASRLGIIDPSLVVSVIRFYSDYQEARRGMSLLPPRAEFTYSSEVVLRSAVDAVYESVPLLRAAERLLGLKECQTPDIGCADGILEMNKLNREH